jgi:hypothetical protein
VGGWQLRDPRRDMQHSKMPPRRPALKTTPEASKTLGGGPFLREVVRKGVEGDRFPFSVPVIRTLERLAFSTPVTYFVCENGSGKSTLLEGIAAAARLPTVGELETRDFLNAPEPYLRELRKT